MNVLILGGDGYLGWPTAMFLSNLGHNVAVIDNYLRRSLADELALPNLSTTLDLEERVSLWGKTTGYEIKAFVGDCCDFEFLSDVVNRFQPDTIVHYAEQPSAPYSMIDHRAASLTLQNNLNGTLNLIWAVNKYSPDCHIIKLGTMGEYGTPDIDIEEGWLNINHKGREDKFLYPRQGGSLYHTTKIQDTDLLWFYVRMWGLRVTDLMQGPVYGCFTDEIRMDERLNTFFSYDEIFGTVLNRFIVQAVCGYPLTIYGKGNQIRGYLNLIDTINCIKLAAENPAEKGELRIFNQFTETFSVNELADKVIEAAGSIDLDVQKKSIQNPRNEKEEHYYNPAHTGLTSIGLLPKELTNDVIIEMLEYVIKHKENIIRDNIFKGIQWKR